MQDESLKDIVIVIIDNALDGTDVSWLWDVDIDRFVKILFSLQSKSETVILIEHNIEFITKVADYIIDFGVVGGEAGGRIAVQGLPETVFGHECSSLYQLDGLSF